MPAIVDLIKVFLDGQLSIVLLQCCDPPMRQPMAFHRDPYPGDEFSRV